MARVAGFAVKEASSSPVAYDQFAEVYNRHWTQTSLSLVKPVTLLVLPRLEPGARLIDVCCGTGVLLAELAPADLRLVGLDGSRRMLERARARVDDVPLIQADVRRFGCTAVFDAAVCMFDSLNHMLTLEDLRAAFRCVCDALVPGGWFLFDLNTEAVYLKYWKGVHRISDPDMVVTTRSTYDRHRRLAAFDVSIETERADQSRLAEFKLLQRYHRPAEVSQALEYSGLIEVGRYGLDRDALAMHVDEAAERTFFLCRKP